MIFVGCALWSDASFGSDLATFAKPQKVIWLDQGWDRTAASWFHHADQGTQTFQIPYEWFVALEQPTPLAPTKGEPFASSSYLDQFGFIPDDNPNLPPIGFAHGSRMKNRSGALWKNPQTGATMTTWGLTCAACHTGRFTYKGTEVRIDGAPANTNLKLFQTYLVFALSETLDPLRLGRFENRVLGPNANLVAKMTLTLQLISAVGDQLRLAALESRVAAKSPEEGYGRLDALNRIGNTVFSLDLHQDNNYAPESAPVHFPRIWDAPWFLWVQYDGSIEQPMVRNAGEALGVGAPLTSTGTATTLFQSGVHVDTLYAMEKMLSGAPPNAKSGFTGLRSPRWPSNVLPPINAAMAARGQVLYATMCQGCHLPPVTAPGFWSSKRWTPANQAGERYLDLHLIPTSDIGTDSAEAAVLPNRRVSLPANLGIQEDNFGLALGDLVGKVINKFYDDHNPPYSAADRDRMNGHRPNDLEEPLAYKARPLDGVWATPPYLHNGSVATLFDLLSPASERPKTVCLGTREYDPLNGGLQSGNCANLVTIDTTKPGNLATGHEFRKTPGPGVIGRYLEPDERRSLVEYLKTL